MKMLLDEICKTINFDVRFQFYVVVITKIYTFVYRKMLTNTFPPMEIKFYWCISIIHSIGNIYKCRLCNTDKCCIFTNSIKNILPNQQ